MEKKLFDKMIKQWSELHYASRRFYKDMEDLLNKEENDLTSEQSAIMAGLYDQFDAFYEEIGLNDDKLDELGL